MNLADESKMSMAGCDRGGVVTQVTNPSQAIDSFYIMDPTDHLERSATFSCNSEFHNFREIPDAKRVIIESFESLAKNFLRCVYASRQHFGFQSARRHGGP